ncbi:MAG: HAMP domain-containing protein [Acidobacteria bacterium]|nr:HAMP domain-containing protein [Acidobacteriota bacterium]
MPTKPSIKSARWKLHTKTTMVVSFVVIAAFLVIAYFADLATTQLSDQRERDDAQGVATRIAATVEHHVKHQRQVTNSTAAALEPNWSDLKETISDTILTNHPELSQVRVFYLNQQQEWQETVRLPVEIGEAPANEVQASERRFPESRVINISNLKTARYINALAPAIVALDNGETQQIATVSVQLRFDESHSYATTLRSLLWPLMGLAILATTLSTFFLFRLLVYKPLDHLLLAMAKAEAGDLSTEVQALSNDEIGLLTTRFKHMLSRLREMSEQVKREQQRLEERVSEATSELAERNEQLEETNLRLFEMQRQLTQFERMAAAGQLAAQFAHEVGTPLNLISGHVQLLRARSTSDKVTNRLDVIAEQIERITKIVRSMLDSTRRPQPKFEVFDLNALVIQIIETIQPTLAARNVGLITAMAEPTLLVKADQDQIQQVFINLINNSLDAMPEGGNLTLTSRPEDATAIVELSDNGEGIAPDHLHHIFDPLFSTKREHGTGLGLTIVRQIVYEHGGDISVRSTIGQGTTFQIKLALQDSALERATPEGESEELLKITESALFSTRKN